MRTAFLVFARYAALVLAAVMVTGCGGGSSAPSIPQTRVACVGDSITYGLGTSNRAADAYPAVLGRSLGSGYQVNNFGVGGTTALNASAAAYQRQNAFTRALQFKPDILIVALGTNDSNFSFTPETKASFETDYKTLLAAFKNSNPLVKVYVCLPVPSYPLQRKQNVTLSTAILPLIEKVAQNTGASVIDLNTPFTGHPELFTDKIHPTTVGAQMMASLIYNALTGL